MLLKKLRLNEEFEGDGKAKYVDSILSILNRRHMQLIIRGTKTVNQQHDPQIGEKIILVINKI